MCQKNPKKLSIAQSVGDCRLNLLVKNSKVPIVTVVFVQPQAGAAVSKKGVVIA
jgi:hypothetical protein